MLNHSVSFDRIKKRIAIMSLDYISNAKFVEPAYKIWSLDVWFRFWMILWLLTHSNQYKIFEFKGNALAKMCLIFCFHKSKKKMYKKCALQAIFASASDGYNCNNNLGDGKRATMAKSKIDQQKCVLCLLYFQSAK